MKRHKKKSKEMDIRDYIKTDHEPDQNWTTPTEAEFWEYFEDVVQRGLKSKYDDGEKPWWGWLSVYAMMFHMTEDEVKEQIGGPLFC